jgi:SAM-dependent methyltransferase
MNSLTKLDYDYLEYWESLYNREFFFGSGPTKLAEYAEPILKKYNIKRILEVGCGQGRDALHFAQLGYNVDAFDISHNAVKFLKNQKQKLQLENLNVIIHDSSKPFDFKHKQFDFVYSNLALQFFELETLAAIFKEISRVLKTGSLFLFSTKKEGDKYYNFGEKIDQYSFKNKGIIRYFFPREILENTLLSYFDIEQFESDKHVNLDSTTSVWWKILLKNK